MGPIFSNGGAIQITGSGSVVGGPDGVDAPACPITMLTNETGGTINGAAGGAGFAGGAGGVGVSNANMIATLTNSGTISGGDGGSGILGGGAGGVGVSNAGTIETLTNSATISGGNGAGGGRDLGGAGGVGVSNANMIATLTNSGTISGGTGGNEFYSGAGGAGGAGLSNSGVITTLTNSGAIYGGLGGNQFRGNNFGAGGAGITNVGTIATLTNGGTISGGADGAGGELRAGNAILSTGSIGLIANSGQIDGNVEIDNQASVTIYGGTGTTFGKWTGGTISVGNGDLDFAGGNTALGDNIVVNGGRGTVFNSDPLSIAAPQSITGNFDQSGAGVLDFGVAGDTPGQYGALAITGFATLDGGLGLDLLNGFKLTVGDVFDLMTFAGVTGDFTGFSLDGTACSATSVDVWACGSFDLQEVVGTSFLNVDIVSSSLIPEFPTWAMLGMDFLGLGFAGYRTSRKAVAAA